MSFVAAEGAKLWNSFALCLTLALSCYFLLCEFSTGKGLNFSFHLSCMPSIVILDFFCSLFIGGLYQKWHYEIYTRLALHFNCNGICDIYMPGSEKQLDNN